MSDVDENFTELAIDALVIVHNHLYLMEQSIRREIKQKTGREIEPPSFSLGAFEPDTDLQMEHEIEPDDHFAREIDRLIEDQQMEHETEPDSAFQRQISQQIQHEIQPEIESECVAQRDICFDFWRLRNILRLLCSQIWYYARRAVDMGYMDEKTRTDIAARAVIRLRKIKNRARLAGETLDVDEQRPLKIQHTDPPTGPILQTFHEPVEGMDVDLPTDPIPEEFHEPVEGLDVDLSIAEAFHQLVEGMGMCRLDNQTHKDIYGKLMVYDPKRKARVPSRFCSFHLDGFNLDAMSEAKIGPRYQPADYAAENVHQRLATFSTNVVSIRVVKAGPRYPVEVYGKVIARDEIDYKCVYLFDRERKHAQIIHSEKDMLALTGPNRALVTSGYMYFEFDLKIKSKDDPDDEVQFSKGVIPYFCRSDRKRIILQLPSFESTVKLVLQHVDLPLAASLEVSVVKEGQSDPITRFNGKITAGTTRNYRQHMLLYDSSSVCRGVLVGEDGSLALNRNVVAVNRWYVRDEEDEKLVLYVCFLDADFELEDEDWTYPEDEDEDDDDDEAEAKEAEEQVEKDPKNYITLKYPLRETVLEHGGLKLRVKVDWTAVLDKPEDTDFFFRHCRLPDGFEPDYRFGVFT